jgi:pimeloyl-ACP methyl ester carboxylesterase
MFSLRQALSSWYMAAFQTPGVPEWLAAWPGGPFDRGLRRGGMTREEVERFRREIVDYGALPGALSWYRAMPFSASGSVPDKVSVPTTMLWSDGDVAITRVPVDRCADYVDGPYELRVLEGASHWLPTQQPQAVADAVLARIGSIS